MPRRMDIDVFVCTTRVKLISIAFILWKYRLKEFCRRNEVSSFRIAGNSQFSVHLKYCFVEWIFNFVEL